ncbi:DoxX family protein [Maribacter sp. Asnod1-A12]|uniref:DoxX family protein n=1 Tax=Maribacter sp. Asnod1-A12 TaxID=3160576 RepID=UPI00386CB6EE
MNDLHIKKQNDIGLLILRVTIAGLMLFHGVAKLSGIDPIKGMVSNIGLPEFLAYGVYLTELIAPITILIGWRTRIASVLFFFGMIAAMLLAHADTIFAISIMGGLENELILLYAFGALTIFFTGGGKYAVANKNQWD